MKRSAFVPLLIAVIAVLPPCAQSAYPEMDSAVTRYVEAAKVIASEWSGGNSGTVVRMAFDTVSPGSSRYVDEGSFTEDVQFRLRANVERACRTAPRSPSTVVDMALRRLLARVDPWSSYMTPQEWRQYQLSLAPNYFGVGMDLEKEKDGSFTCWPYPGSPADDSGIRPGAKLLSVGGNSVEGMSIYAIGAMVRGPRGRSVNLGVSRLGFMTQNVSIVRQPYHATTVFRSSNDGRKLLRIARFSSGTAQELAANIKPYDATVELDLAGCRGGDLDAAVSCASLFIGAQTIATIRRKGGGETLRTRAGAKFPNVSLLIHQDRDTASAAEVFIQALTRNQRAESYGSRSYGKAYTQDIIPLDAGGALVLTTGLIYPPYGGTWQGSGLSPTR